MLSRLDCPLFCCGQVDLHGCALAGCGMDPYLAVRLLCETVNHGKAETGALTEGLCGEEGIERLLDEFGRHSDACVRDGNDHIRSRCDAGMSLTIRLVEIDSRGFDSKLATLRHCIPGVDDEVEDGAFELIGVDQRRGDTILGLHGD